MKRLFDQNLSPFLCGRVADLFPDSIHVREIGLSNSDDAVIWHYAADHGYVIVSKDADFRQRSFLYGHPPKIIWVGVGNCSTSQIADLLRCHASRIEEFVLNERESFLVLS